MGGAYGREESHLLSLIRASNDSPSFSTYILSLLLRASRICGSTSGVWAALNVALSASVRFTPLRSKAKGDVDWASMLSMDMEVSIRDGGDNGEVILGTVELVVREANSLLFVSCGEEGYMWRRVGSDWDTESSWTGGKNERRKKGEAMGWIDGTQCTGIRRAYLGPF